MTVINPELSNGIQAHTWLLGVDLSTPSSPLFPELSRSEAQQQLLPHLTLHQASYLSPPPALYSNVPCMSVFLVAFPRNTNTPHSPACLIFPLSTLHHLTYYNISSTSLFSNEYVNIACLLIYLLYQNVRTTGGFYFCFVHYIAPGSSAVPGT